MRDFRYQDILGNATITILISLDEWDKIDSNEISTPPENVTGQLFDDVETSSNVISSHASELEMTNIRRDLNYFNLMAYIVTMI